MSHPGSATSPGNPAGHWTLPRLFLKGQWPLAQVGSSCADGAMCFVQWRMTV